MGSKVISNYSIYRQGDRGTGEQVGRQADRHIRVKLTLKISRGSVARVKSYSHFLCGQTERRTCCQTDRHTFFYHVCTTMGGKKFACVCGSFGQLNPAKFLSFHFVKLALLISLMKDKYTQAWEFHWIKIMLSISLFYPTTTKMLKKSRASKFAM